ncbi:MAG: hypothetical protein KGL39_56890 [Patescibacteria group bacterium]|nr:hypothetical protein [Patescibacteria group bacterium]
MSQIAIVFFGASLGFFCTLFFLELRRLWKTVEEIKKQLDRIEAPMSFAGYSRRCQEGARATATSAHSAKASLLQPPRALAEWVREAERRKKEAPGRVEE